MAIVSMGREPGYPKSSKTLNGKKVTLTGRDRRHSSATPPISAAATPTAWLATPPSQPEARAGLPARRPASCSAVTSTTSSTLPARAQRRRGAGWLTVAPVSHPSAYESRTLPCLAPVPPAAAP